MWCKDLFVDDRVGFDPWMVQCPMNVGLPLFINIIIIIIIVRESGDGL